MSVGRTNIRLNLGASSAFATIVLILVCVGFMRALTQQEAVTRDIQARDLARTEMVGTLLRQVSENQRMLSETLTAAAAGELREEDVFHRGRDAIDFVRSAEDRFAELKPRFASGDELSEIFDLTLREFLTYRGTVIDVVEISTVNVGLATTQMLKATARFVRLIEAISQTVELSNDQTLADMNQMRAREQHSIEYMLAGSVTAVATLLLASFAFYSRMRRTDVALNAERRKVEETMESLQRAQRIAHMGSLVRDLDTDQAEWSDEMYRIFGVDRGTFDTALESVIALIVPEDRDQLRDAHDQLVNGISPGPFEYRIRRPDGQIRHIYAETELIYDEDGGPKRIIATIHDVTETRLGEAKQRELERQLQHSQKLEALGTLAGGVAHEFNNALMPICMLSEAILEALPPDSKDREDLELIVAASGRARKLVESILSFSRKQDRLKTRLDLGDLLRRSLQMLRATIPATVRINQKIDAVPPVPGDGDQLNQVVVNLVTNAAQAIGAQSGTITVDLAWVASVTPSAQDADNRWVRLRIADTGCGMDARTVERVFEPFFTTKEVGQGTGLGLSVVHGIVAEHGGRIEIESEPGKGTRFTIYLPVDEIATAAPDNKAVTLAAA